MVEFLKHTMDFTGKKCECGNATYQEASIHDDMDGKLRCAACKKEVPRYGVTPEFIKAADAEAETPFSTMVPHSFGPHPATKMAMVMNKRVWDDIEKLNSPIGRPTIDIPISAAVSFLDIPNHAIDKYRLSPLDRVNNVLNGDCLDLMNELLPSSADLLVCDPPFNIGYKYDKYRDNLKDSLYLDWSKKWIEAAKRVLKPNGTFWLVIGDKYVSELDVMCKSLGFTRRSFVVWHYTFGQASQTNFTPSHTNLLYYVMDPKNYTFNADCIRVPSARQLKYKDKRANPKGKLPDNVWDISRLCGTFKERVKHTCQLPLELTDRIILSTSNPGDFVVDPMCGSGSVLVSAALNGRNYLGIELSENYVQVAKTRLVEARGKLNELRRDSGVYEQVHDQVDSVSPA